MNSLKRSTIPSSLMATDGNTEEESRFTCVANRLDSTSVSRKHTFNEQRAQELMKKHMKKKAHPVTIFCLEDRLLFRSNYGSQPSKRWRTHAKYADIRNFYVYSSESKLIMLTVMDSEHKNKKYYESFQCDTAESANQLCQLIGAARNTETNTLPPKNDYQKIDNIDPHSKYLHPDEELAVSVQQPRVKSKAYLPPISEHEDELEPSLYDGYASANDPITEVIDEEITPSLRPLSLTELELANSKSYDEVPPKMTVSSVACSPFLFVRDSRRQSKVRTIASLRVPVTCGEPVYRTYRSEYSCPKRTKPDYSRTELPQLFGEDVTFLSMDNRNGAIICDSGPVFLYALRLTKTVEPYKGEDLMSATNSPLYQRVW